MSKTLKYGIFAIIGGGLLYLLAKGKSTVSTLKNFTQNLTVTPKLDGGVKRISFKNSKLNIPLAIDFANRSETEIKVGISNIVLYYNSQEIGNLKPNNSKVLIKKFTTSTLSNLIIEIPILKLLSVIGVVIYEIIKDLKFDSILNALSIRATCIFNDAIVFDINRKLNQSQEVNFNSNAVNGLGLVAQSKRVLKPFSDYESYIPPKTELKKRDLILIPNGSVEDTVKLMKEIAVKYATDTKYLANWLKRDNLKSTVKSVFDFVYNYIQYVQDSRIQEQVRRPLRTLWDRKGDCDCFATLIGSIFVNLNIPFKFRIAAYNGKPNFQHVYVIVPHNSGYYVCDPVLDECFYEKQPSKYLDF